MATEIVFNILVGLGVVFYLANALQLPTTDNAADVPGAAGFPIFIGILGLIILAMITIRVVREKHKVHIPLLELHTVDGRMLLINVLLLAAYVSLLEIFGFWLCTLIYLIACPLSIGYRKPVLLCIFSAISASVLVGVFGRLFFVPLPRGVGFLRELSYIVY